MDFDELTNEEQIVLETFKKIVNERGLLHEFYFFSRKSAGVGGYFIFMKEAKKVDIVNKMIYFLYSWMHLNHLIKRVLITV